MEAPTPDQSPARLLSWSVVLVWLVLMACASLSGVGSVLEGALVSMAVSDGLVWSMCVLIGWGAIGWSLFMVAITFCLIALFALGVFVAVLE